MLFIISRSYETVWMEIMKMKTLSTYSGKRHYTVAEQSSKFVVKNVQNRQLKVKQ